MHLIELLHLDVVELELLLVHLHCEASLVEVPLLLGLHVRNTFRALLPLIQLVRVPPLLEVARHADQLDACEERPEGMGVYRVMRCSRVLTYRVGRQQTGEPLIRGSL